MWVIGPYEVVWVTTALVFLILAPPLMGGILVWVRKRRQKRKEAKAEATRERERDAKNRAKS
ncbi:MAG: hypothetical protein JKY65_20225 [Planctomycetes bacterium]|nr:hypothetical protein [Planctomycetota bacterium]